MKRTLLIIVLAMVAVSSALASPGLNDTPDAVVGKYVVTYEGQSGPIRVEKDNDGTYSAYVDDATNYRLVRGLKYNAEKKQWDGAKMRDPRSGISANCFCRFNEEGVLVVRGQLFGIGKTIYWVRRK